MKRLMSLLLGLAVITAVGGFATAQSLPDTAVTKDHPLYAAKMAGETGTENLAPNASAKARTKLQQANRRAAEMEQLANQGKSDLAEETGNDYAEEMQGVNDLGGKISDLAQKQKINELVAAATQHHQDVLQTVMDKVPEQAKQGIQRALDSSTKGYQMASKHVGQAHLERCRQAMKDGNAQLDKGNNENAQVEYRDAERFCKKAESWAEKAGPEGTNLMDKAASARDGADKLDKSVQAYQDGDTEQAELYGQQAQQAMGGQ